MPGKEVTISLRDLVRGAFQGAARGASDALTGPTRAGGLLYLAPQLSE
jgi:hypothetical protein